MSAFPNAGAPRVPLALHIGAIAYSATLQSNLARRRVPFDCVVVAVEGGVASIGGTTVPSAVGIDVVVYGTIANGKLGATTPASLLLAGTTTGAAVASSTPATGWQANDWAFGTAAYRQLVAGELLAVNALTTGTTNATAAGAGVTVWVVPK